MTSSSRFETDKKTGETLIQLGDKYLASGEVKRAAESYSLAKDYLPEAQEKLRTLPQWTLPTECDNSVGHPLGEGCCHIKVKDALFRIFKSSSLKSSITGPFFTEGAHPPLPMAVSKDTLKSQESECTFYDAPDTNSVVSCYIGADEDTKLTLRNQINEIINQFDNNFICMDAVRELVVLAMIPDRAVFSHIITQMLKVIKEKPLFASIVLQGMAVAINSCPDEIDMSDMQGIYLEILRPLLQHLKTLQYKQNQYQLVPLLHSLSAILNAMVCKSVSSLDRETIFNPLYDLLDGLKSHDDTTVIFLAMYAKQALAYIGNNESLAMSIFRRARLAILMAGDIAGAATSVDLNKLESAYDKFTAICDFSEQAIWYQGLAYVDGILELQNWSAFEAFVLQSKLSMDEYFLQGICLRLEQIASTQQDEIRTNAIKFLQAVAASSPKAVQKTAQAALKRMEFAESSVCSSQDSRQQTPEKPFDCLTLQANRDFLLPVWDPIWHRVTRSTLLKAVQQKERTNKNIDEMHGHIVEMKSDIESGQAQTMAALDKANTNIDKVINNLPISSTLGDVEIALQNYYEPLLVIKRVSGKILPLESCYINLAVVEAPDQREKDKQDLKAQSVIYKRIPSHERTEGTNMASPIPLEELFKKQRLRNGSDDVPKTILIHGRAGIGKTTLCKKLVDLSLCKQLWRECFDAVVWLPLRELKSYKSRDLENLMKEKYFPGSVPNSISLSRTLFDQAENGKVLFILDGLDEFQRGDDLALDGLLFQLLKQKRILITSRPSGVDKSILPPIDLELETVGFSPQNVNKYLHIVVPEEAEEINNFIRQMPVIQGLVNIPVQLDAICYSWDSLSKHSNDITMTELYQVMVRKLWYKDAILLGKKSSGQTISANMIKYLLPYQIDVLMSIEMEYLGYLAFKGLKDDHQIIFDENTLSKTMQDLDSNRKKKNKKYLPHFLHHDLKKTSFLHSADAGLDKSAGILCGSWHFLHLTFQEYFAATWITRHLQTEPTQREEPPLLMTFEETKRFVLEHKYNPRYEI
ncbi:hypothetical protein BGX27_006564, partial [Mortierella sp. AM989]